MPPLNLAEPIAAGMIKAFAEQAGPDRPRALEVFAQTVEHDENELGNGFLFALGALCGIADELTPEQYRRLLENGSASVSIGSAARAAQSGHPTS
jgi:hypothetical protein